MSGSTHLSRRRFLQQSARGLGLLAAAKAAAGSRALAASAPNPFAYDVDRFAQINPNLIKYEQVARFSCGGREPRRLSLGGPLNRLYVAVRQGIVVLEGDGAPVTTIPLATPARCIGVAPDGTVYAGTRERIELFDVKGQPQSTWTVPGKKPWLTGLAVGETAVFAADSGNRVCLRFERSGKLTQKIGEKNKERNVPGLIVPSPYLDVALGRDGLLRVNNPGRHCVETYTQAGDLEFSWGRPSAAIDGFCGCCNPIAVALLPDGRCITCEKGLPRVKLFSTDGKLESVVGGPQSFPENAKTGSTRDLSDGTMGGLDAVADGEGRIYVLDLVAADIRVMKRKVEA